MKFKQTLMFRKSAGFTLIEILVVVGIFLVSFSIAALTIYQPQGKASLSTTVVSLVSDLQHQQLKSMLGESEGATTAQTFGIHFESATYTLFRGSTYSSSDSDNFVVNLGQNVIFSNVTFPSSQVVFNRLNGEVSGFNTGQASVTIQNTVSNEQQTVTLNKYGVPSIQ